MGTDQGATAIPVVRWQFPLHLRPDQADPLRRSGLSDPMAAIGAAFQHARLHEQPRRGCAQPGGAGTRRRLRDRDLRRDEPARAAGAHHPRSLGQRGGQALVGIVGVQSNQYPARARHRPAVPRRGRPRLHRRLSRLGLPRHAARHAGRTEGGAGARDRPLRGRIGGRPVGRRAPGRVERRTQAALRLHGSAPLARAGARPDPAAQARRANLGHLFEHRSRPRLPVPVLVLHHHQRAGPQEPVPHPRRPRKDHPGEQGPGHRPVLHHRRQFRPQQRLGDPARPGDRAEERRHPRRPHHPGRHALPQDPELHREGEPRRGQAGVHRARKHQPGEPDRRKEAAEQDHRISRDAAEVAGARRHHLRRLHPRLPGRHQGTRSCATSRSSSTSCRSTSWSSSSSPPCPAPRTTRPC